MFAVRYIPTNTLYNEIYDTFDKAKSSFTNDKCEVVEISTLGKQPIYAGYFVWNHDVDEPEFFKTKDQVNDFLKDIEADEGSVSVFKIENNNKMKQLMVFEQTIAYIED